MVHRYTSITPRRLYRESLYIDTQKTKMNEMWGTTRQGRGYNIRKYWQNNIQTVHPYPNPPINTPDSSTTL